MPSTNLPPIPRGNLLEWVVKNPRAVESFLRRIVQLSNTEVFAQDSQGAITRRAIEFSRENGAIMLPLSRAVTNDGTDPSPDLSGFGDVFGPNASAVDNVAVFQTTSGKRIRDSGININDLVGGRIASYGYTDVAMNIARSVGNGSGDTVLNLDTEVYNDYGVWSAGNPSRFTFPTSGIWLYVGRIDYAVNATSARLAYVRKNGSLLQSIVSGPGTADVGTIVHVFGFDHFAANDYVELIAQQWSGGSLNASFARLQTVRIDVSAAGGGGGGADLASIVCASGDVVTAAGEVVWNS